MATGGETVKITRYVIHKNYFIGLNLFWLNVFFLGMIVRLPWIYFRSADYFDDLKVWYYGLSYNGFVALQESFTSYNVTYPYPLALAAIGFPNLSALVVIKGISIIFDLLLAFFVYKCISLKYSGGKIVPYLAALVTLLAPSVILNSAMWGQCDSIYVTFLIACIYALLKGRQIWAFIAFGLSFSFKLQAVFLAPLFLWLLMKKQLKWQYSFLSLLVYLVLLLPAWLIAGRPLGDLLLIYVNQAGYYEESTKNAPNLYQWLPTSTFNWIPLGILIPLGIALTTFIVLAVALSVYKSRIDVTEDLLVHLATFSAVIVPFLLPKMHERYFFFADAISIIFAFYFPRYWPVPVVMNLVSSLAYFPFVFNIEPVPLPLLAIFILIIIVVLGWKLLRTLGHLAPSYKHSPALPKTATGQRSDRQITG